MLDIRIGLKYAVHMFAWVFLVVVFVSSFCWAQEAIGISEEVFPCVLQGLPKEGKIIATDQGKITLFRGDHILATKQVLLGEESEIQSATCRGNTIILRWDLIDIGLGTAKLIWKPKQNRLLLKYFRKKQISQWDSTCCRKHKPSVISSETLNSQPTSAPAQQNPQ